MLSSDKPLISNTVIEAILFQLQRNPNKISLEFCDLKLSNQQLYLKILELAKKLQQAGIKPSMRVGVFMQRSADNLICLFSLWQLSVCYVPLNPELPLKRIENICEDAQLDFLIAGEELAEKIHFFSIKKIILSAIQFNPVESSVKGSLVKAVCYSSEKSAYLLYTSGSTGKPKGVEVTQGSLSFVLNSINSLLTLNSDDVFLGLSNFSFDIAFFELIMPFLIGAKLVLVDQHDYKKVEKITDLVHKKNITVIQATPSFWRLLNAFPWNINKQNVTAIATGEALPVNTARDIYNRCNQLWNLYGPTECTIWATAKKIELVDLTNTKQSFVSIGKAISGLNTYLMDEKALPYNIGKGQLCITGPGLAKGYYGQSKLTENCFIHSPSGERAYLTGDICSYQTCGEIDFHGRLDNQVKHNGYRIELEEVEAVLEQHNGIELAQAGLKTLGKSKLSILFAFIVFKKGTPNKTSESLNQFLARSLPHFMLPQRYFFINAMPLTVNGKKDRNAIVIPELFSSSGFFPPRNSDEKKIAGLFCEILEIKEIGIYDSFFDVGGNSMLSASLLLSVNYHFATHISLKELLLSPPTVDRINNLINKIRG